VDPDFLPHRPQDLRKDVLSSQALPVLDKEKDMPTFEHVLQQHRELDQLVTTLRVIAETPRACDLPAVPELLRRLESKLVAHFELEERGGDYDHIVAQRPELEHKVTKLLAEHARILGAFGALVARSATTSVWDLAPQLIEAIDALQRHERAETRLMQDAFLVDLATGD
jgi:hypothetical protein